MNENKSIYGLLVLIFAVSISCEVVTIEENTPNIAFTESFPDDLASLNSALTNESNRTWNITGFKLGESSSFQTCRLDDALALNADGTYSYDGGNELCGSEDNSRFKTGTWEVDFDSRTMYFDKGTEHEVEVFIESCQGSKVVFSSQYFGMKVLGQFEF